MGLTMNTAFFLGYDVSLCKMFTEQILDLIINYAYVRKKEIEKHRVLLGNEQDKIIIIILLGRLMMEKSRKLTIG